MIARFCILRDSCEVTEISGRACLCENSATKVADPALFMGLECPPAWIERDWGKQRVTLNREEEGSESKEETQRMEAIDRHFRKILLPEDE